MRHLLLAVVAALALAGCATAGPEPVTAVETSSATVTTPASLSYPDIGVRAPLEPTGLTDTGELAVPALHEPQRVVYANWSPTLAERMPTVLAAHVNGRAPDGSAIPGGFVRLAQAEPGDELTVTGADGQAVRYAVTAVDTVDKDAFPTDEVFASGGPGRLVLVTCGGEIDHAARSYESNVIVHAEAVTP